MLKNIFEPVISQIAANLLAFGTILLLAVLGALWKKVYRYLLAHFGGKEMELLQLLANQGYSLVESEYKNLQGSGKLQKSLQYVQREADRRGIPFNAETARAAVEQAWMLMEGQYKKQLKDAKPGNP